MPIKVNIGLIKKVGQPHYGSLGASCGLEWELDTSLLNDLDSLQTHFRQAYVACRRAVHDELARQTAGQGHAATAEAGSSEQKALASHNGEPHAAHRANGGPASGRQLSFLRSLARRIDGLGIERLEELAQRLFQRSWNDLSAHEASRLIEQLVAVRDGQRDLATLIGETAS